MSMTTVGWVGRWSSGHGAEEGELRLLVAAEHARVEVVVVAHLGGELVAVGGVAHGGGEHGDVGLALVLLDLGAVSAERVEHPLAGLWRERAAGVDAVAEAGDVGVPDEHFH